MEVGPNYDPITEFTRHVDDVVKGKNEANEKIIEMVKENPNLIKYLEVEQRVYSEKSANTNKLVKRLFGDEAGEKANKIQNIMNSLVDTVNTAQKAQKEKILQQPGMIQMGGLSLEDKAKLVANVKAKQILNYLKSEGGNLKGSEISNLIKNFNVKDFKDFFGVEVKENNLKKLREIQLNPHAKYTFNDLKEYISLNLGLMGEGQEKIEGRKAILEGEELPKLGGKAEGFRLVEQMKLRTQVKEQQRAQARSSDEALAVRGTSSQRIRPADENELDKFATTARLMKSIGITPLIKKNAPEVENSIKAVENMVAEKSKGNLSAAENLKAVNFRWAIKEMKQDIDSFVGIEDKIRKLCNRASENVDKQKLSEDINALRTSILETHKNISRKIEDQPGVKSDLALKSEMQRFCTLMKERQLAELQALEKYLGLAK